MTVSEYIKLLNMYDKTAVILRQGRDGLWFSPRKPELVHATPIEDGFGSGTIADPEVVLI